MCNMYLRNIFQKIVQHTHCYYSDITLIHTRAKSKNGISTTTHTTNLPSATCNA